MNRSIEVSLQCEPIHRSIFWYINVSLSAVSRIFPTRKSVGVRTLHEASFVTLNDSQLMPIFLAFFSSFLFKKDKYPCQRTANTPENMNRYCGIMKAKLKAVTAGHSLREFFILVGTAFRILSMIPDGCSPVRIACIPKKYVLKTGVKRAC